MKNRILGRTAFWVVGLLLLLGVGVAAFGFSRSTAQTGCSAKVICPITAEELCKDQCQLVVSSRADCPGKIECPLTGELVCRDRCPLEASAGAAAAEADLPPCCQNKQQLPESTINSMKN